MFAALDIIVVVIIVISLIVGISRGFVRSLMGLVSVIIALAVTFALLAPTSAYIQTHFVDKIVTEKVVVKLAEILNVAPDPQTEQLAPDPQTEQLDPGQMEIEKLVEEEPPVYQKLLDQMSAAGSEVKESLSLSNSVEQMRWNIVDRLSGGLSSALSLALAFIILFVGAIIVLSVITFLLSKLAELPGLNVLNRVGGAVLGLIRGALIVFVLCTAIALLMPYMNSENKPLITQYTVDNTTVYHYFHENNFLMQLFGKTPD
jgi:uncharacterized membrane protein required for colicin V production